MTMDRRTVLGLGGAMAVGAMVAPGMRLIAAPMQKGANAGARWAMLIDLSKCSEDCTDCTTACATENNIPQIEDQSRQIQYIRKITITDKTGKKPQQSLPVLCNHCENPPCVDVCPTNASFIRKDGLVLVDKHRCIGCRYCMIACPYKARSLVYHENTTPKDQLNREVPIRAKGVVEKCSFCVHRIDKGEIPACVEACGKKSGAMLFGDINDPKSEIAQKLAQVTSKTIRDDLGLKPHVHYTNL
ncbi:4Fe-4S ferredoxin, iron-sulfur binding domain protein [Magnetococcus marinus MC-1]|uniref:4Fe-4S ferredoxin, iron-sulfur binding domain protein n=1 Tax=Magnetococcus marinus (strain ATCC BAA-1437 / JCM 17883 / MC-1) TaxID=156889 RepID=A0L8C4_MAGMM|nr:4Fe-4S dicluster domain-containing protein [Magnetococcus marinus]ABK44217.1 4Fe-4S ferredoxin, iron-sulfur binding domain protein [Magnetococcus marinus MC-1]